MLVGLPFARHGGVHTCACTVLPVPPPFPAIVAYEITLITGDDVTVVPWTVVGDRTSVALPDLALEAGVRYVLGVRALDRVGHASAAAYSTGQVRAHGKGCAEFPHPV